MTTTKAATWFRVSTGHQDSDNQIPDVQQFTSHHGYTVTRTYQLSDTAWRNSGGALYKATLQQALDDAHKGVFSTLVIWSLDRLVRDDEGGAEAALRIFRLFRQRGCTVVSVKESWLNASSEVQDVLLAFAGWQAQMESERRSARIKAGLQRRRDQGLPVGRKAGSKDKGKRKRSGYIAAYEPGGKRHHKAA